MVAVVVGSTGEVIGVEVVSPAVVETAVPTSVVVPVLAEHELTISRSVAMRFTGRAYR